jgi:predicted chitinase
MMTQQVIVTTKSNAAIKPLVEAAIQNEKRLLLHGIQRTRQRLAAFEAQSGMTSSQFERRYNTAELEETLDYADWLMEIKALELLEEQYQALKDARFD